MDTKKHKKIYYIPGLFSLLFVPILFYFYYEHSQKTSTQTVIKLVLWNPDLPKEFPKTFIGDYPAKRNYQDIYLSGDNQSDKIKLDFSQVRIREILTQNDSINGVHYHFGDSSEYWAFVKILDIFKIEQTQSYLIDDNDIWFMHYPLMLEFKIGSVVRLLEPKS